MRVATMQKLHNSLNRNFHIGSKMYEDLSYLQPLSHFTIEACLCLFSTELSSPPMNGTEQGV